MQLLKYTSVALTTSSSLNLRNALISASQNSFLELEQQQEMFK